ncbi:class I SAM-dependent methyltransferase [Deinococcus radiophilus]|uniref:class I SAM-dependent methyltransferase n=1 Tax=Deinococcus radiophilus TaxID=32062 RepID=UPI00360AC306
MLEQARQYPPQPGLSYALADGATLPVASESQDGVLCAAGLFFMEDMEAALREWQRVLCRGGRTVLSSFTGELMAPLPSLWAARLAPLGLRPVVPPAARIASLDRAAELLTRAGFTQLHLEVRSVPLTIRSAEERWEHIVQGLEGLPLRASARRSWKSCVLNTSPIWPRISPRAATFQIPLLLAQGEKR